MPLTLHLTTSLPAAKKYIPPLRRLIKLAHPLTKTHVTDLSIAIVNDRQIANLHQQFLNIPTPTDVLTFELSHDSRNHVTAGEVVINLNEATRRAREHHLDPRDELLLYALHGLLHLSGHDDTTKPAYTKMHRTEDQILTTLGIGRIFAPLSIAQNKRSR